MKSFGGVIAAILVVLGVGITLSACNAVSPEGANGVVGGDAQEAPVLTPVIVVVRANAVDGGAQASDLATFTEVQDRILADVFGRDGVRRDPSQDGNDLRPRLRRSFEHSNAFSMLLTDTDAERLAAHPDVERVVIDQAVRPADG
jgi:hypothetical protein